MSVLSLGAAYLVKSLRMLVTLKDAWHCPGRQAALFNSLLGLFRLSRLSGWLVSVMELRGENFSQGVPRCCLPQRGPEGRKAVCGQSSHADQHGAVQCSHDGGVRWQRA